MWLSLRLDNFLAVKHEVTFVQLLLPLNRLASSVRTRCSMDVLQMPAEVATLSEVLLASWAGERPPASMLSEVVTEIAALLKHGVAVLKAAFEE